MKPVSSFDNISAYYIIPVISVQTRIPRGYLQSIRSDIHKGQFVTNVATKFASKHDSKCQLFVSCYKKC